MKKHVDNENNIKEAINSCRRVYVNNKIVKDNWQSIEEIDLHNIEFISWERKKKTLHLKTKLQKV